MPSSALRRRAAPSSDTPILEADWGARFDIYCNQSHFEPQATQVSDEVTKLYYEKYGVFPLASMETLLRQSDPRVDETGVTHSTLVDIMTILQNYKEANPEPIFHNYYGYVCIRHLLHSVCLAVLRETGFIYALLPRLKQLNSWETVSHLVAKSVVDFLGAAAKKGRSVLDQLDPIFDSAVCLISPMRQSNNLSMLTCILWEDRDSFLLLSRRGMLPGCAVLLFTIGFHLLPAVGSTRSQNYRDFLYFQDLSARLYLVGATDADRAITMLLCGSAMERGLEWPVKRARFQNANDSRMVAQAYSDLFELCSKNRDTMDIIPVAFMAYLAKFVHQITGENTSATISDALGVVRTSFNFLWLFFEVIGRLGPDLHQPTIDHGYVCITFLGFIQSRLIKSQAQALELAGVVSELEVVAVAGRILLLLTDDDHKVPLSSRGPKDLLALLHFLKTILDKTVPTAPRRFAESAVGYAKVMHHANMWILRKTNIHQAHPINAPLFKVLNFWDGCDSVLGDTNLHPIQRCTYPRCYQGSSNEKFSKMYYQCEDCRTAIYCSLSCGTRHWQLKTSDSHQVKCGRFNYRIF